MAHTLGTLARQFKLGLKGEAGAEIRGVCSLNPGKPGHLAFLANPKHAPDLATTAAAAVVLNEAAAKAHGGPVLIAADPYLAFAQIARLFDPGRECVPGVHPQAVVSARATVASDAHVGAGSVIEDGARIGSGVFVGPLCHVGRDAIIGAGTRLDSRVTVMHGVRIGERCRLLPGAVVGSRGFGNAPTPQGWQEVPQLGSVVVGNDVEIGANTTIDRGALDDTVIEDGVKLDNQIHVAHNVHIGAHTAIAGCVGIAGSARIGRRCIIAGASVINGHVEIGDDVVVQGMSMVTKSLPGPGQYASGTPAEPVREWRRTVARVRRLGQIGDRLAELEQRAGIKTKPSGGESESNDV